ncbi:MAG TPA: hypothetical protein VF270_13970 [Ignavibacteriaceae bacterium]
MKINIFLLFVFFVISSLKIALPQSNADLDSTNFVKLSRFRLSFGYVNLLSEDNNYTFRHPFFNLSFRSSSFDRSSSNFKVKIAFEPGINGLIIANKDFYNSNNFSFYFLPYAKFGPDIRLDKNIFLAGSVGVALATYETNFAPLPFIGVNGFYLYELNQKFSIELESGVHTSFGLPLLLYITIGISLI